MLHVPNCCMLVQGEQSVIVGHCVIVEHKCVPDGTATYVIF